MKSKCFLLKPQHAPNVQQYPGMAPVGQYQQYPVGQYPAQGTPQPAVHGAFDPGARFGAGATVNIPVSAKLLLFSYCVCVILTLKLTIHTNFTCDGACNGF